MKHSLPKGLRVPSLDMSGLRYPHGKGIYFTDAASQVVVVEVMV